MGQNQSACVAVGANGATFLNLDDTGNLRVAMADQAPSESAVVAGTSGNVTNASAAATLAAASGKTTHISGFSITGAGATAASVVSASLAGVLGGDQSYTVAVPTGVTLGISPIVVTFDPPLPASAVNTAIVLTLPALGAGNTHAAVSAWGYQA